MWSRDDGIRQWAGFTKQPEAAGTAACYLMSLMLLLAPRRTQLGGKLENLGQNLLCSLLTSFRAGTVPLHPRGASRQSWWGQAFLGDCDPSVISSPDQHADVQEQAVLSQEEVQ